MLSRWRLIKVSSLIYRSNMSNANFPELVNFIQECDVKLFEEGCNSIIDVIGKFIENNDDDSAFYIVNIKKIVEQYEKWS